MFYKFKSIPLFIFLLVISAFSIAETQSNETLIEFQFATDPWPPFFLETTSKQISEGIGYELVVELFKTIPNAKPTFPKLPWKRALLEVETGAKDAIALLLKTDERAQYMEFTKPLMQTPALIFFNKKSFPDGFSWGDVSEFNQYKIGVVRGYSYGEPFDTYIASKPKNVHEVTSSTQLFSMLQRQRIDLVPENSAVAYTLAADQGWLENLGASEKVLSSDILHIGISKKSKHLSLLAELNRAIDALYKSGKIDRLVGQLGSSVKPELN